MVTIAMISNNQVICTDLLSAPLVASPTPGVGRLAAGAGSGGKALATKGPGISLSRGRSAPTGLQALQPLRAGWVRA